MQVLRVYRVACVFMVKRILDFLRVKNNDGPNRICSCNCIANGPCTSDSCRHMGRIERLAACRLDKIKLARKCAGLSTGLRQLSTTPQKM
jgi:hypothetical protein